MILVTNIYITWKLVIRVLGVAMRLFRSILEGFYRIAIPPITPTPLNSITLQTFQLLEAIVVIASLEHLVFWIMRIVGFSKYIYILNNLCLDFPLMLIVFKRLISLRIGGRGGSLKNSFNCVYFLESTSYSPISWNHF